LEFEDTVETVRAIVTRLDSPASSYNLVFSESEEAVEVSVEHPRFLDPLFVFTIDSERFRVIKALEIDPNGYATFTYHGYVELLSYILEYFYPVYYKLNPGISIMEMLSRVLGKSIRVWKDLITVLCAAGDVEFYDFGSTIMVMGVNFSYNLDSYKLALSGDVEEEIQCKSVMELVTAILTVLSYIFRREDLEINPILGDQIVDEGEEEEVDMEAMDELMGMESDIDGAMGDDMGAMGGEDLSSEFEPAGDSMLNTAPDAGAEGKGEVLDEVYGDE
jgi:hypothetical protein